MVVFIKLDTPALTYLRLRAHQTMARTTIVDISASTLDRVVEATVDLNRGKISYSGYAIEFVGKLSNVKCLILFTGQMKISDSAFLSLTTKFHNLTELGIGADLRFITKIFENANHLRRLMIHRMDYHSTQRWIEPKQMPEYSLISHLEDVRLFDFEWSTNNEFDMMRYILKNAIALGTVNIIYTSECKEFDWSDKVEVLNELASYETRSPCLRLRLFNYIMPT